MSTHPRGSSNGRSSDPAENGPSMRLEKKLSGMTWVLLASFIVLWSLPRLRYAQEIDSKNLVIFNRWEQSDNRFFLDWADKIADGDLLGREPNHPIHEWHILIATKWLGDHPAEAERLKSELPSDADEKAVHQHLWNRWYGGNQFHQEPLYPYLLAALKSLFGDAYTAGYAFQSLLGIVNGLLLFFLSRRLFGSTVAVTCGILYAFAGFLMFHEQTMLRTTATCTMTLLLVVQGMSLFEGPSTKEWLWFGVTTGVAILLQSIFLLFLVGFVAVHLWKSPNQRASILRGAAYAAFTMLVVVSPAFARNIVVGAPTFSLSSVGSVTFIASNHPTYTAAAGWNAAPEIADIVAVSESRPSAAALATLGAHEGVGSWVSMLLNKARSALHGVEWAGNENYFNMTTLIPSLRWGWVDLFVLYPLGIVGLVFALRHISGSWVVALGMLLHLAVLVGLYVVGRFRAPMAILLIPFAAWTIVEVFRTILDRHTLPWVVVVGTLIGTVFFCNVSQIRRCDETRTMEYLLHFNENFAKPMEPFFVAKDYEPCIPLFEKFFESTPDWLNEPSSAMLVSPNMRNVAKFFADRRKYYGDTLSLLGRTFESERQRALAKKYYTIADVK